MKTLKLTKMKMAVISAFTIVAGTLSAETYTWQGTSGGSWNDPSNWSVLGATAQTVPGAGDTAGISGVASIVVNADAAIGGLTLTGSTGLSLSGSGKLTLGQTETVFDAAVALDVSCELTGAGKLVKRGIGDLSIRADNTFTGGFLGDGAGGDVYAYSSQAFGEGQVTVNHNTVSIYFSAPDLTVANDFVFTGTDAENTGRILAAETGLKLTGKVDFYGCQYARLVSNSKGPHIGDLRLYRRTPASNYKFKVIAAGNWYFDGQITGYGVLTCDNSFTYTFNTSGNAVQVDFYNNKSQNKAIVCNVANVFDDSSLLYFYANVAAAAVQRLEMNGLDQVVGDFYSVNNESATYKCEIVSTGGKAMLTSKGTANREFFGKFGGGAGLCWAPTDAYTLTLDVSESDTTGTLIASNGVLSVTGTSNFKNLGGVEVYAGATLSFASGTKLNTSLETLVLQEGATFSVADGVELVVGEYYTVDADGNRELQPGDTTYDLGGGVSVRTAHQETPLVEATWTAGGGADTLMSTAANWDRPVDLKTGGLLATFADAGIRATVDDSVKFKGLVFDAPGIGSDSADDSFYIMAADADSKIELYEYGIVERVPATGTRTYDVRSPLDVWSDQLWDLPAPTSTVAVCLREKFVLNDSYRLEIRGGGEGCGRVSFEGLDGEINGTLVVTGANVVVKGDAWKNAGEHGKVDFWDRPSYSAKLTLSNAVIGAAMEFHQMTVAEKEYGGDMPLGFAENSTNVFNGELSVPGGQYLRFNCPKSSQVVFAGGMDYPLNYPVFSGSGQFIVTDQPVYANGWWHENSGNTVLKVPGNCIATGGKEGFGTTSSSTGNGISLGGVSSLTIACDDALAGNTWVHISGSGKFDLGGYDVHVGNLRDANKTPGTLGSQFTSPTPAVLTVSQLRDESCVAAFTGGAGIRKLGGKTLTMLSASTSTGTVEVTEGTLDFAPASTWRSASSVKVSGGTLKLATSSVFGKKTDVHLSSGTLDLSEGVCQVVGDLYLNGSDQSAELGFWGAIDNQAVPENHRTPLITGSGILKVHGQRPGLVLLFR